MFLLADKTAYLEVSTVDLDRGLRLDSPEQRLSRHQVLKTDRRGVGREPEPPLNEPVGQGHFSRRLVLNDSGFIT